MTSVKKTMTTYLEEKAELDSRVDTLSSTVNSRITENTSIKEQIVQLQNELNFFQQKDRLQNLEIVGIPERSSENLNSYILNIAKIAGVVISLADIDYVSRVQARIKITGRPRVIIVKLKSRFMRDSIISGIRKNRGMTTKDLDIPGDIKKIYVNEHLTPANKQLLKKTKEKANASKFQYVWVRDGKIYARKEDNAPVVFIRNEQDLSKII